MGYIIISPRQQWILVHREYKGSRVVKTRHVAPGTPEADALGVFPGMSEADARKALTLHRADGRARYHSERRARIADRIKARQLAVSAWLPATIVAEFERVRLRLVAGGRDDRWLILKEILIKVDLPPYDWHWQPEVFWEVFRSKGWGLGYVRRFLRLLNRWGEFYCERTGKKWYAVASPRGAERDKIQAAHFEKLRDKPTNEMTPDHLGRLGTFFPPEQADAVRLAFWCALRPEELKWVLKHAPSDSTWYMDKDSRGFHVFHIFQEKLRRKGIEHRLCWKAVPLVEPEQEALIPAIEANKFRAPSMTKMKENIGLELTARSARKGFSIEMEARGYERKYVDDWLGHIGKDTASRSYRTRRLAMYAPPVVWQSRQKT